MTSKIWHHDELQEDLAAHLRATRDRVVWTNMQLGPSGSPRPDVFTMPKSFSKFRPLAYEMKISVSDFRRDVTSGKWQNYLKFASGVIFAVPAGLISKDDVPAGCGLIVRHGDIWRTAKGPTLRMIDTLPLDAWIKLMIDGIERQANEMRIRQANSWLTEKKIRKAYGDEIADALSNRTASVARLNALTATIQAEIDATQQRQLRHREEARAVALRDAGVVNQVSRDLATALGIPEDSSPIDIKYAAKNALARLNESDEIARLQRQLDNIKRAIGYADEAAPALCQVSP